MNQDQTELPAPWQQLWSQKILMQHGIEGFLTTNVILFQVLMTFLLFLVLHSFILKIQLWTLCQPLSSQKLSTKHAVEDKLLVISSSFYPYVIYKIVDSSKKMYRFWIS